MAFAASLVAMRMRWRHRTVDLRIASVLLLAVSVVQKRDRAVARQRLDAAAHHDGGSPIDRIKRLVTKS
jgi:hypothetical protein